jgi:hypothetical protein
VWGCRLHFFTLLLPGNDDITSVPANVDDGAKVESRFSERYGKLDWWRTRR